MTLRDQVWDEALTKIVQDGKFQLGDLPFDESERHTVRRSLKNMEEAGWLMRTEPQSPWWRMGEKSETYLAVSPQAREKAKA